METQSIDHFVSEQKALMEREKVRLSSTRERPNNLPNLEQDLAVVNLEDEHVMPPPGTLSPMLDKMNKNAVNTKLSDEQGDARGKKLYPQNEMDKQWVTDVFYNHFPSCNNDIKTKERNSEKQQAYKLHLNELAKKAAEETKRKSEASQQYYQNHANKKDQEGQYYFNLSQKRDETDLNQTSGALADQQDNLSANVPLDSNPVSPRTHQELLKSLKHTEFHDCHPTLNPAEDRNAREAAKANNKKMEYQQELMKQIEEKKREVEAIRARDKAEDEKLTKRMQEQMKTMHLEEELVKERGRSQQARLESKQNRIYRMHIKSYMENENKVYNPHVDREFQSQNEIKNLQTPSTSNSDKKIYKYFSNSAKYPTDDAKQSPAPQYRASHFREYCKRCEEQIGQHCDYCERKRRNIPINAEFCLKCAVPLTPAEHLKGLCHRCQHTDYRCGFCRKKIDMCPKCDSVFCAECHQRANPSKWNNNENVRPMKQGVLPIHNEERPIINIIAKKPISNRPIVRSYVSSMPVYHSFEMYEESDSGHEQYHEPSIVMRNDRKPYSTNVDRSSIFHPNHQIEEPKVVVNFHNGRIFAENVDEKLAKYARNYGDLRRSSVGQSIIRKNDHDSPLPMMPQTEPRGTTKKYKQQRYTNENPPTITMLKHKWEIPAVQKTVIASNGARPTNHRVLTQTGAIRKQLQLEQLDLDKTILNSPTNHLNNGLDFDQTIMNSPSNNP